MLANDMKKGTQIVMLSGELGTIMDNRGGMIRVAEVEGIVTEMGSIYIDDIDLVLTDDGWEKIEFNQSQQKRIDKKNKILKRLKW
jgi:hypothetical protein